MSKPKSRPIFDESDFPVSVARLAIMQGLGMDIDELKAKPIIAVASSHTEMNPGHMHPEAAVGGPIAALRDGDEISIDIPGRSLEVRLSPEEIVARLAECRPSEREVPPGFVRRYVKLVGSASRGAVLE